MMFAPVTGVCADFGNKLRCLVSLAADLPKTTSPDKNPNDRTRSYKSTSVTKRLDPVVQIDVLTEPIFAVYVDSTIKTDLQTRSSDSVSGYELLASRAVREQVARVTRCPKQCVHLRGHYLSSKIHSITTKSIKFDFSEMQSCEKFSTGATIRKTCCNSHILSGFLPLMANVGAFRSWQLILVARRGLPRYI